LHEHMPNDVFKSLYEDKASLIAATRELLPEQTPYEETEQFILRDLAQLDNEQLMRAYLFLNMAQEPEFIDYLGGLLRHAKQDVKLESGGFVLLRRDLLFVDLRNDQHDARPGFRTLPGVRTSYSQAWTNTYHLLPEFEGIERFADYHIHENCMPGPSWNMDTTFGKRTGDLAHAEWMAEHGAYHGYILNNTPEGDLNVTYYTVTDEPVVVNLGTYSLEEKVLCE